ncbi:MAG: M1 family metallopeptidase [Myxococcota bacterium]|nr:M1 family metallopeptidase [Myxococcota bacterium]
MSGGFTDKSLLVEGREWGWFSPQRRPFAEPGVRPNYGPSLEFVLSHLSLRLRIQPEEGTLEGEALLHIEPTPTGLGVVRLDLTEVDVTSVALENGEDVAWRHDDPKLVIEGLEKACVLRVVYTARPRRGLYFVGPTLALPDREHQVWSQCQDEDGHYFFPCVDHPGFKQTMQIVIEAPEHYTTVSNGRLIKKCKLEDGWLSWSWEQDKPMPAYLVNVIVAKLDAHADRCGELEVNYLVAPGTPPEEVQRIFGRTPEMIRCFEERYGVAYPWARYDQIVVEDFIFGGMENVAATTLTDLTMATPRAAVEWDPDGLIAHELAHQWFGDLVTCQDWSQGWLNEGWATYSEAIWLEWSETRERANYDVFCKARGYFSEASSRYSRPVVTYLFREPIDVFDRHLYEKGACVLHTLRNEIGEDAFWTGTKHYLETHAHQTVHTRNLQDAFEHVSGRNLDGFFQQWIRSAGFPDLAVKLNEKDGLLTVSVTQSQQGDQVPEAFSFMLGVTVHGSEDSSLVLPIEDRERSFAIPVGSRPSSVTVDPGFSFLSRMSIQAPLGWLVESLGHSPCSIMRIRAAEALARMGGTKAVSALDANLRAQEQWWVRRELARCLGEAGGEFALASLKSALKSEKDLRVRSALVRALRSFRGQADDVLLAIAKEGDASLFAEAESAAILGAHQSSLGPEACLALLGRESWGDKLASGALRGLGASRDPRHLTLLLEHASPAYPERHRAAAAGALGTLADEVPEVRVEVLDCLIDLALNGGFRAKLAAISALGKVRDPRALGVLGRLHSGGGDGRVMRSAYEAMCSIREGRSTEEALQGLRGSVEKLSEAHSKMRDRVDRLETPVGLSGKGD